VTVDLAGRVVDIEQRVAGLVDGGRGRTGPGANGRLTEDNGERFRRRVLAHGGSIHAMEAYRDHRGQDPDPTHLLRRRGLNPA
jgi:hypothetical protein